jgi:pyridoxine 4-dehydrogenase
MAHSTSSVAASGTITIGGDLTVHRLAFGAMRITGDGTWGFPPDRGQAIAVLRNAIAAGVDFIDTADSYGPNTSEELIAEALHPYPQNLVIATKGGLTRPGPGRWDGNGRPEHLRSALEGSLKRLRVERIDLYQFHRPDPKVPLEESLGVLVEAQRAGKIRHIGISNVSVEQLAAARRFTTIVSVQNRYNAGDRASQSVADLCDQEQIVFIPWAPIQNTDRNVGVRAAAETHGATPNQIVLAWLLAQSSQTLPIPGSGSADHVEENIAATSLQLTAAEQEAIMHGA